MIIAGAIAGPLLFQVDNSNYGGVCVALSENNPNTLVVVGKSLHGIARAPAIFKIAFLIVDLAFLHDLLYFCHRYLAAIHSTASVIAIL